MSVTRGRSRALRSAGASAPGPSIDQIELPSGSPGWPGVEELLSRLAATRAVFPTATSRSNWISSYEPGRRLRLETDGRSNWVQVANVKACWEIFERLGRVRRRDVLEPGRCSAFVMALFAQVDGVHRERGREGLVLRRDERPEPLRVARS